MGKALLIISYLDDLNNSKTLIFYLPLFFRQATLILIGEFMTKLLGFHKDQDLSVKTGITRGSVVLIPKGTLVKSTHPSRKEYVTRRDLKVKVHHFMNGISVPFNDPDYEQEINEMSSTEGAFCSLGTSGDGSILPRGLGAMVPVKNPSVTWVGSAGYWCEADINQVVVIKE